MEMQKCFGVRHTVTAGDVTATTIVFNTLGPQIKGCIVQVRTAAGVLKDWNGAVAIANESITIDNTGATDWAATDTVDLIYW